VVAGSFNWLVKRTRDVVRRDPGLSNPQEQRLTLRTLPEDLTTGGVGEHRPLGK
jgi:hypothetical protein